jgi:hypothetical protein
MEIDTAVKIVITRRAGEARGLIRRELTIAFVEQWVEGGEVTADSRLAAAG